MHIRDLGTYRECRDLCEGKRYRTNGRRIDNYTVLKLVDRDTPNERIAICRRSWIPYDKSEKRKDPEPFAWYNMNNTIDIPRVGMFSTHQLGVLFGLYPTRSRHDYKVVRDTYGNEMLYGEPIKLLMNDAGTCAKLIGGTPTPTHQKDSHGSLEWRRAKHAFDKTFLCALKVGAFADLYHNAELCGNWKERTASTDEKFVEAVRACDPEAMVRFMLPFIYKRTTPEMSRECLIQEYKNLYARRRRDILVAAGARVKS